jgi:superoxide oxidase
MTKNLESADDATSQTAARDGRFDHVSIALHWLTVLLIIIQFASVWAIEAAGDKSALEATLLSLHMTSGVLTWCVVVVRLIWRHYFAHLPPFPPSMPKFQQTIAKANEYGLYLLLLTQPITGIARVLLRGRPFDLFFWQVPALFEENDSIRHIVAETHEFGAKALMVLVGLHAGAALFHYLILRDGVLQRMLPLRSARTSLMPALVRDEKTPAS